MSELVVLSHLRWTFVWQRPQQIVSRLAAGNRRTWFVEEPQTSEVERPTLRTEQHGQVTRVWLDVPGTAEHVGFEAEAAQNYAAYALELLGEAPGRVVWLYTPMAIELGRSLKPQVLVYDVMDDLASFKGAPVSLEFRHGQALHEADLVFAGGRSLHASVASVRPDAHLLPSGVEPEHYAVERRPRPRGTRPVAGYVGVIDERIDLTLIAGLARALGDWEIRMVGPIAKISEDELPRIRNLTYQGRQPYEALPAVMAEFDVAIMPFALNEATRSISPTKTLEYLASGLPVVSTRVPDVVSDYEGVVAFADDTPSFAMACRHALTEDQLKRERRAQVVLRHNHWHTIAARMSDLIDLASRSQPRDTKLKRYRPVCRSPTGR